MPQAQTRHIACAAPIDEATRVELLQAGQRLRSAQNLRQNKRGAIEKRPGFDTLTANRVTGAARSTGERMTSFRGAPVVIDSSATLDVYDAALVKNVNRGNACECLADDLQLPRGKGGGPVDIAIVAGLIITSYKSYAEVAVCNAETGVTVLPPTAIVGGGGSTYEVKLASFSDRYVIAFVYESGAQSIVAYLFDATSPSTGFVSLATVVAAGAPQATFTVSSYTDRAFVGYGTTTNFVVKSYNAAGLVQNTGSVAAGATVTNMAIDANAGNVWIAFNSSTTDIKATAYGAAGLASPPTATISATPPISISLAPFRHLDIVASSAGTGARINAVQDFPVTLYPIWAFRSVVISGGAATNVGASAVTVYSAMPYTRMFRSGTSYYVGVHAAASTTTLSSSNGQRLFTVADCTNDVTYLRPIAHADPGLVTVSDAKGKWATDASGRLCTPYGVVTTSVLSTTTGSSSANGAVKLLRLDFASAYRWQNVEHNGALVFAGGVPTMFDGEAITEVGFLSSPVAPVLAISGGGSLGTGNYRYAVVWEDVAADGRVTVSGVSTPTLIVTGVGSGVLVTIQSLTVTGRAGRQSLRAAVYRTALGGAPPYYRVTFVQNDTANPTIAITDTLSDAQLTVRPQLYAPNLPSTANEALDRRGTAWLRDVTAYNGMLVGIRGSSIVHSGQPVYGEATWFSPVFEIPVVEGGSFTAVDVLDGNVVAFKEASIFVVSGTVPSDNGTQGGLGEPRRVACDVGCIDPRSAVATSLGIFFRSRRGIELFTRAQTVEFIGEAIGTTLSQYPTVCSAVLDDGAGLVRFELTNGSASTALVYDLTLKAWVSNDTRPFRSVSAAMVAGTFYYLLAVGTLFQESTTTWLDAGNWVTASFQTGQWNHGPLQEQYVYEMQLLFERYSAAGLVVTMSPDYGQGSSKAATFTEAETLGKQVLAFRPKPRGESTIVTVSDTPPAIFGTGRGFSFVAMSGDMAPTNGTTRGTPRIGGRK